jgi:hypothetical protein
MKVTANNQPERDLPRGIGKPATRALANAGYVRLEQLSQVSAADLLKLHGVGPKALSVLRTALQAQGLAFADEQNDNG